MYTLALKTCNSLKSLSSTFIQSYYESYINKFIINWNIIMKVDLLLIFEDNAILIDLTGILTYLCSERNEFLSLYSSNKKATPKPNRLFHLFPRTVFYNCIDLPLPPPAPPSHRPTYVRPLSSAVWGPLSQLTAQAQRICCAVPPAGEREYWAECTDNY